MSAAAHFLVVALHWDCSEAVPSSDDAVVYAVVCFELRLHFVLGPAEAEPAAVDVALAELAALGKICRPLRWHSRSSVVGYNQARMSR